MTNKHCLNCNKKIVDKFCSGCGQKTDTHRITFKNFIFHDVIHGTFHLDKGILFTAKQALIRPGKAALDYIAGKRKPYYNVFYLNLLTIGIILFLRHFIEELSIIKGEEAIPKRADLNEASKTLNELISQKSKLIILLFVPFGALNSFIIFRRHKLNLSEHSIITGMILLGMLLITTFGNLFFYADLIFPFSDIFADVMSYVVAAFIIFHIGYGYYNAFGNDYTKWGITYRIMVFFTMICLEIIILFMLVFGFLTNWKFGTVNVSLF